MTAHSVVVDLPEALFRRIERAAKGLNQPMPQALLRIVENGLPSLDKVPPQNRADLESMETWTDQELWRVTREDMPSDQQTELTDRLRKNKRNTLNPVEEARLDSLHGEANRLMLRKSHAFALLKWRGNKVPGPATPRIIN